MGEPGNLGHGVGLPFGHWRTFWISTGARCDVCEHGVRSVIWGLRNGSCT